MFFVRFVLRFEVLRSEKACGLARDMRRRAKNKVQSSKN
jgi:hypothetical protein